jgi:quercetin dioxygenase-like cupin family protein
VTLNVAPGGYLLDAGEGEALWFAGGLLTYKTTGAQTTGTLAVAEVHAPKGSGSPSHRHHHEDEAWYILEGELTFWLGDDEFTASAGDFVFGPRMVEHRFRVDSTEARFLLLLTPAGFEDFTRACGSPATALTMPPADLPQRDAELLMAAARTYGLDIIEPS